MTRIKTLLSKKFGPGSLVTAAFIGPGTVTVCSIAGAQFGFSLLWALLLSVLATAVLQEMAARLGIITQNGLAENIRLHIKNPLVRITSLVLIFSAIIIGNAAYEAGNLNGAALGIQSVFALDNLTWVKISMGLLAILIVGFGDFQSIQKIMIGLVLLMSISFLVTAILIKPSLTAIIQGLFVPNFPKGSLLTIAALVGTTIVPYNLFLHAALVKEKWQDPAAVKTVRTDTIVSIAVGGLISMSILVAAAGSGLTDIRSALDLAEGLTPIYGQSAKYFLGVGLFAAGLTSSVTAPIAAAYVARGCMGWTGNLHDKRLKAVSLGVVVFGLGVASLQFDPIYIITFAQAANGILLPIIAGFLWWAVNNTVAMGKFKNKMWQNILTSIIIFITLALGLRMLANVFGWF
ncbi:MAG: Nramp family divalent metal transporter [Flavobacteriaceae bacterium]|nr:Nramp family divalent metal transporter [Flavobacteriaceae bacterium]